MLKDPNKVKVECAGCSVGDTGSDDFEVTVPISTKKDGVVGSVKLQCAVTEEQHDVQFVAWKAEGAEDAENHVPAQLQAPLEKTLQSIAEKKICGNQNICPSEVVDIVQSQLSKPKK